MEPPGGSAGEGTLVFPGGDTATGGGGCWEQRGAALVRSGFCLDVVVEMAKNLIFIKEVCRQFLRVEANGGQDFWVCSPWLFLCLARA